MSLDSRQHAPPGRHREVTTTAIHSDEDIEDAIRALTPGHFKKLRAAAVALVRGLDLETADRGHEDLYSEALARTLAGSRAWRQGVDFMYHLLQSMRSIAWTWREHEDRRQRAGLVDAPQGSEGADGEPAPGIDPVSPAPDVETAYLTSRELARFHRRFQGDRTASMVMHGWENGETMKELAHRTGVNSQDLQWAARRIRRFAQKATTAEPRRAHERGDHHGQ